jgi:YfiH family protein
VKLAGVAEVRFTSRTDGDFGVTTAADPGVLETRSHVLDAYGLESIAASQQVHGSDVHRVEAVEPGYRVAPIEADGSVTALRGVGVAVHVADCLPIAIAGPGGVAMLHGGWRGLAAGIVEHGVGELRSLGVDGPLAAAIGPGVGGCCYEAGDEVHAAFAQLGASRGRKLDLKAVVRVQLERAGIATVHDVGVCTLCAPSGELFSHRRDGPETGRQAGIAWLT